MINKQRLLNGLIFPACCLCLACNSSASSSSQPAASAVIPKIEDAASVDLDERGHVSRVSLHGASYKDVQLDWPGEFTPVEELVFHECPWMIDADLEHLSGLPRLKTLKLIRVPITDRALIALEHVEALEELQLSFTNVSGKGLRYLQGLGLKKLVIHGPALAGDELESLGEFTALTSLTLQCSNVSLADLQVIASLKELESLDVLRCTDVTEETIAGLGEMKNLRHFVFDAAAADDAILKQICQFEKLQELDLSESKVSDLGLEPLGGLPDLQRLMLYKSEVKGTGLTLLTGLQQLKYVLMYREQVSKAGRDGIAELKSALPECEIEVSSF